VFGQAVSMQTNIGFLDIMKFLRLTASRVPPANERRAYQEMDGVPEELQALAVAAAV